MTQSIYNNRLHWGTIILTALVCFLLAGVAVFGASHFLQQSPLPASMRNQVSFPVFIPSRHVAIHLTSYRFDKGQKVLSFTGQLDDGQSVTFAEQATPDPINDIPNYYQQFLQTLFEYQAFDGLNGTVHLTHPKDAGQAAVMNSKGTLVFARVARDESAATWSTIFNNLSISAP